jgi:hypothetical protein
MAIGGNLGTVRARRRFFLDERWLLMDERAEDTEAAETEGHGGNREDH